MEAKIMIIKKKKMKNFIGKKSLLSGRSAKSRIYRIVFNKVPFIGTLLDLLVSQFSTVFKNDIQEYHICYNHQGKGFINVDVLLIFSQPVFIKSLTLLTLIFENKIILGTYTRSRSIKVQIKNMNSTNSYILGSTFSHSTEKMVAGPKKMEVKSVELCYNISSIPAGILNEQKLLDHFNTLIQRKGIISEYSFFIQKSESEKAKLRVFLRFDKALYFKSVESLSLIINGEKLVPTYNVSFSNQQLHKKVGDFMTNNTFESVWSNLPVIYKAESSFIKCQEFSLTYSGLSIEISKEKLFCELERIFGFSDNICEYFIRTELDSAGTFKVRGLFSVNSLILLKKNELSINVGDKLIPGIFKPIKSILDERHLLPSATILSVWELGVDDILNPGFCHSTNEFFLLFKVIKFIQNILLIYCKNCDFHLHYSCLLRGESVKIIQDQIAALDYFVIPRDFKEYYKIQNIYFTIKNEIAGPEQKKYRTFLTLLFNLLFPQSDCDTIVCLDQILFKSGFFYQTVNSSFRPILWDLKKEIIGYLPFIPGVSKLIDSGEFLKLPDLIKRHVTCLEGKSVFEDGSSKNVRFVWILLIIDLMYQDKYSPEIEKSLHELKKYGYNHFKCNVKINKSKK